MIYPGTNIDSGPGGDALMPPGGPYLPDTSVPPPVTTTPPPPTNPGIVSSTDARTDLSTGSAALDSIINTEDPYLTYLEQKAGGLMNNSSAPGIEEQNAAMQGTRLQEKTMSDYAAYKAGLATLGIATGLGQYAPELQADRMLQADNDLTAKIQEIQDKENFAIAKAKQARLDNDAATLQDTLDEIRQIKKDKADAIQDQLNKRTQDITVANSIATYAYKELQTLPPEQQEAFLLQLAKDNGISVLALQAALATEQDNQAKLAKSLSSGSGGNAGGYTDQETRKLRAAGIDPNNISVADNYLYGDGLAPTEYDRTYLEENYSTGELWDLALGLGVPRNVNLSKQDEIDSFFSDPDLVAYTQEMLASGNSIDDIINANK